MVQSESLLPNSSALSVLIAGGSEVNIRLIERLLTHRGHQVQVAQDGVQTLNLLGLNARPQRDGPSSTNLVPEQAPSGALRAHSLARMRFDLLLLDIPTPQLDGDAIVKAIRDQEMAEGGHLLIVALTEPIDPEIRARCLAVGMDEVFAKSIRSAELLSRMELLRRRRTIPAQGARLAEDGSPPSLLSASTLLAACGDDQQGLLDLCADFQTYAPVRLAAVRCALDDQDATQLREAAHKLAGLLSTFSRLAGDEASQLEEHAALGQLEAAPLLVSQLELMTQSLLGQLPSISIERLRQGP